MIRPTPSPWRVEGTVIVDDRPYLAICAEFDDPEGPRQVALVGAWDLQGEVNARLVKKAPEMLAACEATVDGWQRSGLRGAVRLCRAAVAELKSAERPPSDAPGSARIIRLSCYGITIRLQKDNSGERPGCGTMTSDLRAAGNSGDARFTAAVDGLESLILAHACAGVDVESPAYVEAVETAVEAIANHC